MLLLLSANLDKPAPNDADLQKIIADTPEALRVLTVDSEGAIGGAGASYDSELGADNTVVLNGPQFHYTAPEEILIFTDTAGGETHRAVFNIQSYLNWSLHALASTNVTYTVFITNIVDADDADETDGNWIDYGTEILGSADKTGVNGFYKGVAIPALKVMIKAVSTTIGDTFSATIVKSA